MLWSFFVISIRNLFRKNRLFTIINISGLSVGLCCFMLVALFVHEEYSFDRYHKNTNNIYRLVVDFTSEGNVMNWARSSAAIGHYLNGYYPEIKEVVRIRKNTGTDLLSYDESNLYEERIYFADSALFKIFDFKLSSGNPATALRDNNSIVITAKLAKKLFQGADAIGKSLRFNNQVDLTVTGILEEIPANSHFIADAFITFSTLNELFGERRLMNWGQFDHYTYVLLSPDASPQTLESKFPDFIKTFAPEWVAEKEQFFLQPLSSIHLHSHLKDELGTNSDEKYAYILSTIALFILLMAIANFVNLSTATQSKRFKEVSIRKILGAGSTSLSLFFWMEALLVSFIALCLAAVMAFLILPEFNLLTGRQLSFSGKYWLLPLIVLIGIAIAFIAGFFPALQSNRLNIATIGKQQGITGKSGLRKVLVTFQFFTSIFLIIATWIVTAQLNYLESSQIGFNAENVVVLPIKDRSGNGRYNTTVNEIAKLEGIEQVSFCSSTPGSNNSFTYTYTLLGNEAGEQPLASFIVDEHFFDLFEIELLEGRVFNPDYSDTLTEVILNEAAVKQFGLTEAIGQEVRGKVKGKVVGIVKDFNHTTLHENFKPIIIYPFTPTFRFVAVKLKAGKEKIALAELEKHWMEYFPGFPIEYVFLQDQIRLLYGAEQLLGKAYTYFAYIAIIIAAIGLIGLSGYMMERKRKEISIRKVFGGSVNQIIRWIYSDYAKVIFVASLAAWFSTYFWMSSWLDGFIFKIKLSPVYFVLPVISMVIILLISTGWQTYLAAKTNPAENLREE